MRFFGARPSDLEVYSRSDGVIRFRIETVGEQEVAIVDLTPERVDAVIAELQGLRAAGPIPPSRLQAKAREQNGPTS